MKRSIHRYIPAIILVSGSLLIAAAAPSPYTAPATNRSKIDISAGPWKFMRSNTLTGAEAIAYNDASWTTIAIPHTWNTKTDRTANTNCWYRTHFTSMASDSATGKRLYLFFEGANDNAFVYLNGTLLGQHYGGYTAFIFDASAARRDGDNVLAVRVDNQNHTGLPSNGGGWVHYGGLHRQVWLLKTDRYCIDPADFASSGVYIAQSAVSASSARYSIQTMLRNHDATAKVFTVKNIICDSGGVRIDSLVSTATIPAQSGGSVIAAGVLSNPVLWTFGGAYLYKIATEVWVDGIVRDALQEKTGFRYYQLSPGFFNINGVTKLLRGACLHAESNGRGNAIDSATILAQFDAARDMGMNFLRLVHYPHSKYAYDLADRFGIGVMTETGLYQNTTDVGSTVRDDNCREMVRQNFNHPSVLYWCAGNEDFVNTNTQRFAAVIKATDSTRPVTYASSGQSPTGCDYITHNVYEGWYTGAIQSFPSGRTYISESGAGGVVTSHQDHQTLAWTVDTWEPEEYQSLVMEFKFQYIFNSNQLKVPLYAHWLFYDIADYKYKGMNTKGLFTYGGLPKDCAYLWRVKARPATPQTVICGKRWYVRGTSRNVKVYSTRPSVKLTVNGTAKGTIADGSYTHPSGGAIINDVFLFENVLDKGKNTVIASADAGAADTTVIYFTGDAPSAPADSDAPVVDLASSNTNNPACFIAMPVQDNWPVYYQCDGKADNTFDTIPRPLAGSYWIATKRMSAAATTLSFKINPSLAQNAEVFVMVTRQSTAPPWLASNGFSSANITGRWTDNDLNMVEYQVYGKTVAPGETVSVGGSAIDFVTLIKTNASSGLRVPEPVSSRSAPGIMRFSSVSGRGFSLPDRAFSRGTTVDLFDCSGKLIARKLNKADFVRFIRQNGASCRLHIVRITGCP